MSTTKPMIGNITVYMDQTSQPCHLITENDGLLTII